MMVAVLSLIVAVLSLVHGLYVMRKTKELQVKQEKFLSDLAVILKSFGPNRQVKGSPPKSGGGIPDKPRP